VPRREMQEAMLRAHVLLFPSLQEATSATVPEALATGLPVICHRICGQGDVVDESCGVRVAVRTPRESVAGVARGLVMLAREPQQLRRLSAGALQRSTSFAWEAKAAEVTTLYRDAIDSWMCERMRQRAA